MKNNEEITVHDFRYDEGFRNRKEQICPTLTTHHGGGISGMPFIKKNMRIRKLTPLECWRLMGFDDQDYYKAEKVNTQSQLYKQAGNSIVVDVLMAIFKEILPKDAEL